VGREAGEVDMITRITYDSVKMRFNYWNHEHWIKGKYLDEVIEEMLSQEKVER